MSYEFTIEMEHETVLTGWERLRDWIRDHAESLRARRDLERVAAEWNKSERHGSALRTGRLLQHYLDAATPRSPSNRGRGAPGDRDGLIGFRLARTL